jgi:hypothetical protein
MQRLEVSGAVGHIYVIKRQRDDREASGGSPNIFRTGRRYG